ncbi:Uncharacterised protein [Klebsiella pneumoniae]|nr:Uncharacterised protein [Klebsiella pneumoniae]
MAKLWAIKVEVDLILDKAAEGVAAAVCLRLHDLAVNAGDRRLAERPLGFAGAGVENRRLDRGGPGFSPAQSTGPRLSGIVVRVHRLHSAGDAVRHISPVMGLRYAGSRFLWRRCRGSRSSGVQSSFRLRPQRPGLAGLVGGADGAVAAGVPGIVVGVVGFMVIVEGAWSACAHR